MKRRDIFGKWFIIAFLAIGSLWPGGHEVKADAPVQVVSAAGGDLFGVAAWSDGSVTGWGYNKFGQVGDGTGIHQYVPKKIAGLAHVTQVAAAQSTSYAVTAEGEVWAWGEGYSGYVNDDPVLPYQKRELPSKLEGLRDVASISTNGSAGIAVHKDGTATLWHVFYDSDYKKQMKYVSLKGVTGIKEVHIMGSKALLLDQDGKLSSLNIYNDFYGRYRTVNEIKAPEILISEISRVAISWRDIFVLRKDGTVLQLNEKNQKLTTISGLKEIADIQTGYNRLYALKQDGTVWQWNYNSGSKAKPFQVKGLTGISAIWGTTGQTGFALNKKGEFLAWSNGYNAGLASGSGSEYNRSEALITPVQQALSWKVNGEDISFYATSGVVDNQLYVPYTSVFEAMGITITRKEVKANDPKAVLRSYTEWSFTYGSRTVSINKGKPGEVYINGKKSEAPANIISMSNSTLFPLEMICEGLGIDLKWNKATGEIVIQS
ncbi:stalk domain-containing protein [Paenibacillus motobuensis]|uniref:stalk domain-containing protein n=1 Tax=Paenibacillus TaxID=44249 RepID=UPI00203FBB77|nr:MULTISPECIES: stalk domain-containing protein [Paenibacillus]MCM3040021.1 stalk domain-containing protein [Paenibacillus lutimineralis]MCM3647125.1 stalk domain-containing protein [Paenibacillus motobuensis]